MDVRVFVADLLVILATGLVSGALCRRWGVSMLVGYLVAGAVIGHGGLQFVSQENHELEYLARAGALLLLFSVGIEFSLGELIRLSRYFFVGGAMQMVAVAAPLLAVCAAFGMAWQAALLVAFAGALSSTVLVFKALAEWGQTVSPAGRRAIGILLFQDVALVPLMLLVPMLTGTGEAPPAATYVVLAAKSVLFVIAVMLLREGIARWIVPTLARMRSVELVVLFTLTLLGGACWSAFVLGLPPLIGALAAGLAMSGNRLSKQVDTILLPYRESFAAVLFVTLGTLLDPGAFLREPVLLSAGLVGIVVLKTAAATMALRLTGLAWQTALAMGAGLAQLGEFSFLLIAAGLAQGIIDADAYNRILFIAIGTLILTPQALKFGLRWTTAVPDVAEGAATSASASGAVERALVIGIGPIGRQIASRLETMGIDVCLLDLSPINLHPFAQQGFPTVAGDARDAQVLRRAGAEQRHLVVVAVPDDETANAVVRNVRAINPIAAIFVRCRFQLNVEGLTEAGADAVVSEEAEASGALLRLCEEAVRRAVRPTR